MSSQSWTPRRAAAATRRHLSAIEKVAEQRLAAIANEWADEDGFLEREAEALLENIQARISEYREGLKDAIWEKTGERS